jgi:type IV pilus assembly protein PilN
MARINLLPWRAERRANRQKEFYGMLGLAAVGGLVLSFLIWFHYNQQISGQNTRNQFLQQEIAKVKAKNEEIKLLDKQKDRLLARKKVIEELQANRSQMVHLFDSLVRTIPDGVALASIKQEGEILTLEGRAQSNARVSTYMRNLESSGWMTKPDLASIEAKDEEKTGPGTVPSSSRALPFAFKLQVTLANPNAPDAEGKVTAAAGTEQPGASPATAAPAAPAPVQAPASASPAPANAPPAPAPAPATAPPSNTPIEKPAPTNQGSPAS